MKAKVDMFIRAVLRGYVGSLDLAHSSCVVPVSLGQPAHEGDKFLVTLREIKRTFKNVTIVVADTLQRHNKKYSDDGLCDEELVMAKLKKESSEWVNRNKEAINLLGDKLAGILYWDEFLGEDFKEKIHIVSELYDTDKDFKKAVDASVGRFVSKLPHPKGWKFEKDDPSVKDCKKYILEECAVLLLWGKKQYNFVIYPFKIPGAMSFLLKKIVYNNNPNLLHPLIANIEPVIQTITLSSQKGKDAEGKQEVTESQPVVKRSVPYSLGGKPATFFVESTDKGKDDVKSADDITSIYNKLIQDSAKRLIFEQIDLVFKIPNLSVEQKEKFLLDIIKSLSNVANESGFLADANELESKTNIENSSSSIVNNAI